METASKLLLKLSRQLFGHPEEQARFVDALVRPQPFHPCILWCQSRPAESEFDLAPALSWQPEFVDRLALTEKPGQHIWHKNGEYYCLDFSSVFAASVLLAVPQPVDSLLDLCAAPGGKSIFAWRALQPKILLCNEVIGKRVGMLLSNLKRCRVAGSVVLSGDAQKLAAELPGRVNVVLVDAPCTGQSLLAKGEKAPGCFHPTLINKNANRQKRILANAAQIVAPGGYLAYTTCAYSVEENEAVVDWLLARFPQFQPVVVPHLENYQSHLSYLPCYRMFPQARLGAGGFAVLLQRGEENEGEGDRLPISKTLLQDLGGITVHLQN